uniref:Downstream neighbor of SON n=1 Tax=Eptatretus burgeri TaxID=7764 RepID=A0A8C4QLQ8_EPTBU
MTRWLPTCFGEQSYLVAHSGNVCLGVCLVQDTSELLCGPEFPADWSIKLRAVFTSSRPFSWVDNLRSWEEARGLDPPNCAELRTGMQRALIYWSWPSLPWITTFPRMETRGPSAQVPKASVWACNEAVQQALLSEWTTAFASLFSLLRAGLCPFFYVCAENFTALFRAKGMAGEDNVSAVLSPTTSGFRDSLRAEGVSPRHLCWFTLEGEEEAENTVAWLRDLGVEDDNTLTSKLPGGSHRSAGKRSRQVDRQPESLVWIRGRYTHLLLNFLLSYRHLVPVSGPHAGLAPTLLSPIAFRNASLHTLKVNSGCLNLPGKTGSKRYSMEIVGPILPHTLRVLTHLVKMAHDGEFHTALLTHTPTSAFNAPACATVRHLSAEPLMCLKTFFFSALWRAPTLGKRALRELSVEGGAYNWTL